ncbi:DUF2913 family protein [Scandinavium sp. M-37]|uniref:DUF2913 family protein n=1 Tax=Scandinavium sp. M-37 TaxID=3373077 RepID=UPI003744E604
MPTAVPPSQSLTDLAHLAWCGLVALKLARNEGQASSPLMTHYFLNRWLATAQKQRRFPKTVTLDITALLDLARRKGPAANLEQRLDYLWQSCSEPLKEQSDLFRLTYVIEQLRAQGWINAVVSDAEWETKALREEYQGTDALLVRKSQLQAQFSQEGKLVGEVVFLVTGDQNPAEALFCSNGLAFTLASTEDGWYQAILKPEINSAD